MEALKVWGGKTLKGSVKASGAKNSATKLLVASLLSDQKCTLSNVPNIGDVEFVVDLCHAIGSQIDWDRDAGVIEIITPKIETSRIPKKFANATRIPILLAGALLDRCQSEVSIPILGGDAIGARNICFHVKGLQQLGAYVEETLDGYKVLAPKGLVGAHIELPYPSVGATENLIFAAVRAEGRTIIRNAALETEIIDLIMFFQKMGVSITTDNDRTIEIFGSKDLYEVHHRVIPDKIEAASYGMAAVVTGGRVLVKDARHEHMMPFLNSLRGIGGGFNIVEEGIEFFYERPLVGGVVLETDVHPGFITDWQQPFAVLLTQSEGSSIIHETVHENRLGYLKGLQKMGAECQMFYKCLSAKKCRYQTGDFPHSAVIRGVTPLKSTDLHIPDLRAGFAYMMAAMITDGDEPSIITNTVLLNRGYGNLIANLESLGANIQVQGSIKTFCKEDLGLKVNLKTVHSL